MIKYRKTLKINNIFLMIDKILLTLIELIIIYYSQYSTVFKILDENLINIIIIIQNNLNFLIINV